MTLPVAKPLASQPRTVALPPTPVKATSLSPSNYALLQRFIYAESGIVLETGKTYLLEARLLPLLREHKVESLDALATLIDKRSTHPLARLVIEAMTTNETLFFRDAPMFDAMRTHVFPLLFRQLKTPRKLRIWSAAASTGQEAYSLAMLLLELGKTTRDVEIVGTDLSTEVLARARAGKYTQFDVNRGLPAACLMKYFVRSGPDWQLKDIVRDMVRFEPLDLRRDLTHLGSFDLILCRNVLIYFDPITKKSIMGALRSQLGPGALLALGCAETVINLHTGFERVVFDTTNFYRPI